MGRFTSKMDVVKQTYRMCRLGEMPVPRWFEAAEELQRHEAVRAKLSSPVKGKRPSGKLKNLTFPEDRLIQAYYDKNPQARYEAVDLGAFEPPTVRRFVWQQLELMQNGIPRKEAYKIVEERMHRDGGKGVKREERSVMALVQRDEERSLLQALHRHHAGQQ